MIAIRAERKLSHRARFFVKPEWIKTAKSPISWGISWRITAIVVAIPIGMLTRKLAPIIIPSIKLWIPSENKTSFPTGWVCVSLSSSWWCQWRNFSRIKKIKIPAIIRIPARCADVSNASGMIWIKASPSRAPTARLINTPTYFLFFLLLEIE